MSNLPWFLTLKAKGKKLTALAFIGLILIGNIWIIYRFTGKPFPEWTVGVFQIGVVLVFVGFMMMLPGWIYPAETTGNIEDNFDDDKPIR